MHVPLGRGSLSITTPVSLLANEFDVRSVLHGQVSLAALSQICVIHVAMNGCKNLKIHYKASFENVNIVLCLFLKEPWVGLQSVIVAIHGHIMCSQLLAAVIQLTKLWLFKLDYL